MKIVDVLQRDAIIANLKSRDKKGVIEELAEPVSVMSDLKQEDIVRILMERERLGSTGIGGGIGIPHGKMKSITRMFIAFGLSRQGVNFESMDGLPTYIFFVLITPEDSTSLHLRLLARISQILKNEPFKKRLMNAGTKDEIFDLIKEEDESVG